MTTTYLSVIIPVYNETKRLHHLKTVHQYLSTLNISTELIVVNDGSTDSTLLELKKLTKKYHFKLLSYQINQGKGYAIKTGMLSARGQYRLFADLDLSTPMEELQKFLPILPKNDIVIASRKKQGSKLLVHQSFLREYLGKGFTVLSKTILGLNVSDFTCGFKCFSQKAVEDIFPKMTINRWGFDAEVLFIAHLFGYQTKEVTVTWINDPNSKVKFPSDLFNSLQELLIIRYNYFKGLYRRS